MRMVLFTEGRNFQGTVSVGKPVEVKAEGSGMKSGNEGFRIKIFVLQHPQSQVDDSHVDPVALQVLGNGRESNRVHLENRGGRNQVTDGPEEDGKLAEVIDRRSM
jgi:hypothetical protein